MATAAESQGALDPREPIYIAEERERQQQESRMEAGVEAAGKVEAKDVSGESTVPELVSEGK